MISLKSQPRNNITFWLSVVSLGVILGIGFQFANAWVAPTATAPNGNIGLRQYVSDCNQFAANGWASKQECLTDGRWHKVQSTLGYANADLVAAITNGGVDVQLGYSSNATFPGTTRTCSNVLLYVVSVGSTYAYCQTSSEFVGSISDTYPGGTDNQFFSFNATLPRADSLYASVGVKLYRSDGKWRGIFDVPNPQPNYSEKSPTYLRADTGSVTALNWYIRY